MARDILRIYLGKYLVMMTAYHAFTMTWLNWFYFVFVFGWFCFGLFCFGLFWFVLFWLGCFAFFLVCFVLVGFVLFCFVLFWLVLFWLVLFWLVWFWLVWFRLFWFCSVFCLLGFVLGFSPRFVWFWLVLFWLVCNFYFMGFDWLYICIFIRINGKEGREGKRSS